MNMKKLIRGFCSILMVTGCLLFSGRVVEAEQEGSKLSGLKKKQLETITVTAQKTEENVQDVPISMTVFDEFTLEDRNIDTVSDIAKYTPGLEIVGYGVSDKYAPSMRGLYSDYTTRSSVAGLYVDGVPITGGTGYDEALLDIERIEVLKGPQGTLYGKNTEVGVINVITKKPTNETRGKIKGTYGSDNKQELIFNVSGPIVKDKLYIGIAGKHYEKDGFVKNYNTGGIIDDKEQNYGKVNLRYTPTDNLELSLISSLVKYNDGGQSGGLTKDNPREVGNDLDSYSSSSIFENALNITYTINDKLTLTSTTAYRDYNDRTANDWDYTGDYSKRFHAWNDSTYKTTSEELKLNYENDNIKLVSGLFYEDGDATIDITRDKYWLPSLQEVDQEIDSESIGIFSHLTYRVTDRLSLLGGLRFDNDKQTYEDPSESIDYDENEISPKVGVIYDLSKNIMSYATVSKGYKIGGFNTTAPEGYSKTYDKESLYSYEMGFKGTGLGNKLNFDVAVYYMDISDMQVDFYPHGGAHVVRTNAAKAKSKGVEASLNFQATDTINLFAGASYNNIKFDEYHDGVADHSGNRAIFAPKYNFNAGIIYRAEQGYYASADISGYGDMYLDSANQYKRKAFEIVNAKIGYEQEGYDIYLYARNLFDTNYDMDGIWGGAYNMYSAPREIGVQFTYRF